MMKFKKFLVAAMTGAMMFGSVAMAVPMVSVYAEDAVSAYTIEINYTDYTAKISSTTKADPYVILEVVKDSSGSKVSSTHAYEMKDGAQSITVDLSFLKAAKPSYLRVRGSSETVTSKVVTVNGMPGKLSLKYTSGKVDAKKTDPAENVAAAFSGSKTSISKDDLNNGLYEYHTLYGGEYWENLAELPQEMVEVAGTTIVVRKVADDSSADDKKAPASAEVKVKIPAAPKAPKVTVDYAKGTIKLPKGAQVRVAYPASQTAATPAAETTDTTTQPKLVLVSGKGELWGKTSAADAKYEKVTNDNIATYFTLGTDKKSFSIANGCTFASAVEEVLAYVDANNKKLFKAGTPNKEEVTVAELGDFFEIKEGAVAVKNGAAALYSAAEASNAIDWTTVGSKEDPASYVKIVQNPTEITGEDDIKAYVEIKTGSTPPPSTSSPITAWKDNTLTAAASQEDILKLFDDTKDNAKDIIKTGFTLFVRTKATEKKAASNPSITTFASVVEATQPDPDKNEVTVGDAKLTWTVEASGIKYSGTGFEYLDSSKNKWVAIKSGSLTKATTTADFKVKVRKAGVKATKTEAGVLPSLEVEILVKKYVDPSVTTTPTKMDAPTVNWETGDVSLGTTKAVTVSRNNEGKISVVGTSATSGVEYKDGTTWKEITTTAAVIEADFVELRAKKQGDKAESDSVKVNVPKVLSVTGKEVSLGGTKILTLARNDITKTTITFTSAENQATAVATLEYKGGTVTNWTAIPANGELTGQDNTTDQSVTITIRVKAGSDSLASKSVDVELASE